MISTEVASLAAHNKGNNRQSTDRIDLPTITITTSKPNIGGQATSGMTQADYFMIKVDCCTQKRQDN
jgi:hypothetical protein